MLPTRIIRTLLGLTVLLFFLIALTLLGNHTVANAQLLATPTDKATIVPETEADPFNPLGDITAPFDWYRYQGENSSGACANGNANCGPTAVAMAIQFSQNKWVPISAIRTYVGGGCSAWTSMDQIKSALSHWNVSYSEILGMSSLRAAINDRSHIVIAPANMSDLSEGIDFEQSQSNPIYHYDLYKNPGFHVLVVKGIVTDGEGVEWIVAYDPNVFDGNGLYWYSNAAPKGKDRYYKYSEFATALMHNGNRALEILGSPISDNVTGVVKDAATGLPVGGATVVLADGKSRSPIVIKTSSDGRYSFTSVNTESAIVTAIFGNKIGAVHAISGTSQDILIAASSTNDIILPSSGKVRATFVSTGSPGDQTGCTGTFGLSSPQSQVIFPDYLTYSGVSYETAEILPQSIDLVFYITPGNFCAGSTFYSTDPSRAVIAHPELNTWILGWEDWNDNDFNDLVVRLDLETSVPSYLASPVETGPAINSKRADNATRIEGGNENLPPVDAYMDHKFPLDHTPVTEAYTGTVTYVGDDSVEPNPFSALSTSYDGNDGTDFRLELGTSVLAAASGTVAFAGQATAYCPLTGTNMTSNVVKLAHDNGYVTEYWWLASIAPGITTGTPVTRDPNLPLGYSGTIECTGKPGMHFVVRNPSGITVDPFGWKPRPNSYWFAVPDPWQTYNDTLGLDAASYPLWLIPTEITQLVDPSATTVITAPSGTTIVSIPSLVFNGPLRVEMSEDGFTTEILGQPSSYTFSMFGYTAGDEPVTFLDNDISLDIALPSANTPGENNPIVYFWNIQSSGAPTWEPLPSTWVSDTGHVLATSDRLGTFAVAIKPSLIYLPLVLRSP